MSCQHNWEGRSPCLHCEITRLEAEIERVKNDPGLYATGDRAILEQNQKLKAELEELKKSRDDINADRLAILKKQERLREAMQEFVDRCEAGHVRSRYTYAKFKELLKDSNQ